MFENMLIYKATNDIDLLYEKRFSRQFQLKLIFVQYETNLNIIIVQKLF